jgi:hypothetical protein
MPKMCQTELPLLATFKAGLVWVLSSPVGVIWELLMAVKWSMRNYGNISESLVG